MITNGTTPLVPCDEDIYKNGDIVGVIDGTRSGIVEGLVYEASRESGIKMDWHYVAGRAVVKTLGDVERARDALQEVTRIKLTFN